MFGIAIAAGLQQANGQAVTSDNWVVKDAAGRAAILDLDSEHDRGWHAGKLYRSEGAALAAIGGTASGAARTIGPYVSPDSPNLVINGDGNALAGWTAFQGGTIASINGEIELTAAGNLSGFSQAIALGAGRAAIGSARGRRGTTATTCYAFTSSNNSTLNAASGIIALPSTTMLAGTLKVSGRSSGVWIGARNSSSAGSGTAYFDDFELYEVIPFAGWDSGSDGVSLLVEFSTPASLAAPQVIAQSDIESERDRIRVELSTTFELTVSFRANNTDFARLDLAPLAASTRYSLSLAGSSAGNAFAASLNGGTAISDSLAELPGSSHLWIGRSYSGDFFQGRIHRLAVVNDWQPDWWLQKVTAPMDAIWTEGDSYVANTGGTGLSLETRNISGRAVITTAVGGSAISDIEARVAIRATLLKELTFVLWDGSPNDYGSIEDYCGRIGNILNRLDHERFVLIPPSVPYGMSGSNALAIRAEMRLRWPDHILDWRDWIANSDGVIDEDRMLNYPADLYHLNSSAMTQMATGLQAFLSAKGW
ncbi:hypothetical protein [Rhizobium halophytocola]|uniref:SGNH/GDSL hydrolase family protein n=1 Tax=Rhizobium halophytocola TaxID=735519 RepID=A0ABS4E0M5_9HYPH|nr:hypothetical protein [Rhizobium halophytocola]MBP1851492.1 hypothetical protein [Rhizobium halophytocola]